MTFYAAKALNRPFIMPNVPAFVLKALFGEMAIVILGGSYIHNHRIATETDFEYQYPEIKEALLAELGSLS
jgi:NAD dependent epimerase/dehydratase family enzyme